MKHLVIIIFALLLGVGSGGSAMYFLGPTVDRAAQPASAAPALREGSVILRPFKVRTPIVYSDGNLSTYVKFSVQLLVTKDFADKANEMQPMVINEINMRTFRTPLAMGPDGQIPNLQVFRDIALASARKVLGRSNVNKVLITDVEPNSTDT